MVFRPGKKHMSTSPPPPSSFILCMGGHLGEELFRFPSPPQRPHLFVLQFIYPRTQSGFGILKVLWNSKSSPKRKLRVWVSIFAFLYFGCYFYRKQGSGSWKSRKVWVFSGGVHHVPLAGPHTPTGKGAEVESSWGDGQACWSSGGSLCPRVTRAWSLRDQGKPCLCLACHVFYPSYVCCYFLFISWVSSVFVCFVFWGVIMCLSATCDVDCFGGFWWCILGALVYDEATFFILFTFCMRFIPLLGHTHTFALALFHWLMDCCLFLFLISPRCTGHAEPCGNILASQPTSKSRGSPL